MVEEFEVAPSECGSDEGWTKEVEIELDDDTVSYEDYAAVTSLADVTLHSLSPTQLLIHTFQTATSWSEISSVLKIHFGYKQKAWDALTPLEKKRVMAITPLAIKKLTEAKKAGTIVDFKEVRSDVYQVQRQGSLFWEVVSKSSLDRFLAQL